MTHTPEGGTGSRSRRKAATWYLPGDRSAPVFTARDQINSAHRKCQLTLPETAIVFFMSRGTDYLCAHYDAKELPEPFPRFLNRCPIWELGEYGVCFLDGGRGAPQAADTVETLAALGVKNILAVGMFGAFDPRLTMGEVIAPDKAFVEEGTSLHYYESINSSAPDDRLHRLALSRLQVKACPIVSVDAVYRQTFGKERLWREKGAVGVDMETSAVFSVSRYLGLRALSLLMVSDMHPLNPDGPKWEWQMTGDMREALAEKCVTLVRQLPE